MCQVSDKLKLCTCKGNAESLKHYWILHRFVEGKFMEVMGEAMPPADIHPAIDKFNEEQLLYLLNETNVFDKEMKFLEKDRLEISFLVGPDRLDRITYGFEYEKGKWEKEPYDVFDWETHHEIENSGKIKNPLIRKRKN